MVSAGNLIVRLPQNLKNFPIDNPLRFEPEKRILTIKDDFSGMFTPKYGQWDTSYKSKYIYHISRREYSTQKVDDLRLGETNVDFQKDIEVASGMVDRPDLRVKLASYIPGEYHIQTEPIVDSGTIIPPELSTDLVWYIAGDTSKTRTKNLLVVPEKTVYQPGEMAKIFVSLPFTGSYVLVTKEK